MAAERTARVSTVGASATKATVEVCAKRLLTSARLPSRLTAGPMAVATMAIACARISTVAQHAQWHRSHVVRATAAPTAADQAHAPNVAPLAAAPPPTAKRNVIVIAVVEMVR